MEKENWMGRRNFLKVAGAAGFGSVLASTGLTSGKEKSGEAGKDEKNKRPEVPKRRLGNLTELDKDGNEVPLMVPELSLGMIFNALNNQAALRESLRWGVNYWDNAYGYAGGKSEEGIGKFLSRRPEVRKDLFIVSKASGADTPEQVEQRLQTSMKRMNTDYIDLYYGVHVLSDPRHLTDELRKWAESAKKRKLIRYFGFSTHSNMAECLMAGAKLDWIDAIMFKYNFREMQDEKLDEAIQACYEKGIGLTAMKTQGRGQDSEIETEADKKIAGRFLERGFNPGQAKILAVLSDKRISSACAGRGNVKELRDDVAAVMNKTRLTAEDMNVFKEVARDTCTGYCAGCSKNCSSALPEMPYVSDVMRYMMYHDSYGERDYARELFAKLPADARNRLTVTDYTAAEASCPQGMPIGKLMNQAAMKLA